MAKGTVNKAIIIGRLGSDPEVRYTPGGAAVANFNVATNWSQKDKDGNWQEMTEWHRVVVWNRLAEVAKEYARKGKRVYIEGRIQTRDWEDKTGQKRYTTEIVASDFQLLDSAGGQQGGDYSQQPPAAMPSAPDVDKNNEDDVPF